MKNPQLFSKKKKLHSTGIEVSKVWSSVGDQEARVRQWVRDKLGWVPKSLGVKVSWVDTCVEAKVKPLWSTGRVQVGWDR